MGAIAGDLGSYVEAWNSVNAAMFEDNPDLARVALDTAEFSTDPAIALEGGTFSITSDPVTNGAIAILHDTDGSIAGTIVVGVPDDSIISAVVTSIVLGSAPGDSGDEIRSIAETYDRVVAAGDGEEVIAGLDGGHWVARVSGGLPMLAKFQDADAESASFTLTLALLDLVPALT